MGVRRLFSRGGQNFSGGVGQKHTLCLKKIPKNILFSFKKTYNFGHPMGAIAPSCPPLRTPMSIC